MYVGPTEKGDDEKDLEEQDTENADDDQEERPVRKVDVRYWYVSGKCRHGSEDGEIIRAA